MKEREKFFVEIDRRNVFAMKPFGREKPEKPSRVRCPATAGVARCPLKPASMNLPYDQPTIYPGQALLAAPPVCCTQQTMSVPVEIQSATRQNPIWGTEEWFDIYGRFRPAVESFFFLVKDPGKEHMTRGRIKMMGLARTSIMVAFWAAATNFRLIDAFERGEQRADDPDYRFIPRQPRRRRAVPYADREGKDPPDNKGPTPTSASSRAA